MSCGLSLTKAKLNGLPCVPSPLTTLIPQAGLPVSSASKYNAIGVPAKSVELYM